ncbi:MAG: LamB/YcsF family protein [Candidatus Bathyarchaeota archaeon]|nr:MAG: LamB/YcsF family protein [Candidatus Bathyarchaeota archaeon]
MTFRVDLNCDLGEAFTHSGSRIERKIIPYITSVNVACGFHAGNPTTMVETVNLAKKNGVAVGAHPGFPDPTGFGRRQMDLSAAEVSNLMIYQVGALASLAQASGTNLQHVKPHGALYNGANASENIAVGIISAMKQLNQNLILFTMAGSKMAQRAINSGIRIAQEVFADRAYDPDGHLSPRGNRGAVIRNPKIVSERAIKMVRERSVFALNGSSLKFPKVDTVCLHSDTPNAPGIVKAVREAFQKEGIDTAPVGAFV